MVIELQKEKARRAIGSSVIRCPVCGSPLSFRDDVPFCRQKNCPFTRWYDGAHTEQVIETIRRC
jgi:endogenous inhibitor of DNA gyrase (YacG/DUF329 family)